MKRRSPSLLSAFLLILCCYCHSQPAAPAQDANTALSIEAYEAQLLGWSQQLKTLQLHPEEAANFRTGLPAKSLVSEGAQKMEVSHSWLNSALMAFIAAKPERKPELLRQMQARLAAQQREADAFRQPAPYPASSRQQLNDILARHEFSRVHGPSAWDLWKQRVMNRILRWLDRLFRAVPRTSHGDKIFVWIVIAAALGALAVWLKRAASRRIQEPPREPIPFAPSARHWRQWLAEARAAAQQGRWRDAIHLAYWAAISQLEQAGAWVPDRARTPREYLRLLPTGTDRRTVLETLTRRFEITWYGQRAAVAEDFADTLLQLEKLGCR